jgi:hypothetical protein
MTLAFWLWSMVVAFTTFDMADRAYGNTNRRDFLVIEAVVVGMLLFVLLVPVGPHQPPDLSWHPAMQPGVWG